MIKPNDAPRVELRPRAGRRAISVALWRGRRLIKAGQAARGDRLVKTLDRILRASKLDFTNVQAIEVKCAQNASPLSCQVTHAARETFYFARAVSYQE